MFSRPAHPLNRLARPLLAGLVALSGPAAACGAMTGGGRISEATERGELKLEDGRTLRLAGLDWPVPDLALDRIATDWTGKTLHVAILAATPDRWGRWLADIEDADGISLSDEFLRLGFVRVKPEFETRNCEADRLKSEDVARRARAGIWADAAAVLKAGDTQALSQADGRLVTVAGIVKRVGVGRSRVYLDFGGRGGFTVVASLKMNSALQRRGMEPASLAGHAVRVRGILDDRFGPRIELADPLMIERIEGSGGSGPGG